MALVLGLVLTIGVTALTVGPAQAAAVDTLFGMADAKLIDGVENTGSGAVRIWDMGVGWRDVETSKGNYSWSRLDAVVSNARASGATELLYVLGVTPRWAAANQAIPDQSVVPERGGLGSSLAPDNGADYGDYAAKVAERYKGRITSFQIWNEADLTDFYRGTPEELASLTKLGSDRIKAVDSGIKVISAGGVPRPHRYGPDSFEDRYIKGVVANGAALDAWTVSVYPEDRSPDLRVGYMNLAYAALARNGITDKPLWESELNYYKDPAAGEFDEETQMGLVARAYVDSRNLGVERSFWYSWESHLSNLGVKLTDANQNPTRAATAYRTTAGWLSGRAWQGCATAADNAVTECSMDGGTYKLFYKDGGSARVSASPQAQEICYLEGNCSKISPGDKFDVGLGPVLVKGAGVGFSAAPRAPGLPTVATLADGTVKISFQAETPGFKPAYAVGTVANYRAAIAGKTGDSKMRRKPSKKPTSKPSSQPAAASSSRSCEVAPPALSCNITGLQNGVSYSFDVVAQNSSGEMSAVSRTLTPVTPKLTQALSKTFPKKLKKGIKYTLPTTSNAGLKITWEATTPIMCKVVGSKLVITSKKYGTCRVIASAPESSTVTALRVKYAITVPKGK